MLCLTAPSCRAQDPVIGDDSCGADTACQNNRDGMTIVIGGLACNEENSCSSNTGDELTVGEGSCNVSAPFRASFGALFVYLAC